MNPEAVQEARALLEAGTTYFQSRNMNSALRSFENGLSIARANKLPLTEAKIFYGIGNAYKYQFRFREALPVYQKALAIVRSVKKNPVQADEFLDPRFEANILLTLGYSHSRLGQQQKAIEYTKEILEINPGFADAYYNLGCYFSILEDAEKAPGVFGQRQKPF
jgi:tetratricopeptide (TPR) repeat protein